MEDKKDNGIILEQMKKYMAEVKGGETRFNQILLGINEHYKEVVAGKTPLKFSEVLKIMLGENAVSTFLEKTTWISDSAAIKAVIFVLSIILSLIAFASFKIICRTYNQPKALALGLLGAAVGAFFVGKDKIIASAMVAAAVSFCIFVLAFSIPEIRILWISFGPFTGMIWAANKYAIFSKLDLIVIAILTPTMSAMGILEGLSTVLTDNQAFFFWGRIVTTLLFGASLGACYYLKNRADVGMAKSQDKKTDSEEKKAVHDLIKKKKLSEHFSMGLGSGVVIVFGLFGFGALLGGLSTGYFVCNFR
ncbi:uncharacterized protein NEMAJ01_0741 [Nematocida major]|uniref:uncharacterized protein n=1 Tax=Nematocida major TaxID=1912982 RepID=UPI0020086BDF|nr:uncharacterized protein NEMAJ01_0741 [Nematocida major]KAH9385845.1 hypothetical protein NEMAJ01_0741 [Nematocida major]